MKSKLLLLLLCSTLFVLNCAAEFRAGIAVRIVTPDPLLPVSGGVGPSHKVTRKEGELNVRALVLEQDKTRVAIVSADFLGFPATLGNKVRAGIKEIPPENILIGATHTHSAPDCYGFPDGNGGQPAAGRQGSQDLGRMSAHWRLTGRRSPAHYPGRLGAGLAQTLLRCAAANTADRFSVDALTLQGIARQPWRRHKKCNDAV